MSLWTQRAAHSLIRLAPGTSYALSMALIMNRLRQTRHARSDDAREGEQYM